jgi:hypothetical protein
LENYINSGFEKQDQIAVVFSFSISRFWDYNDWMIRKTVQKHKMDRDFEIRQNLQYWLSRPPEERLEAVEILRRQVYGEDTPRLQRVVRVVKLSQS